jgi:hypothetical protein
VIFNDDDGTVRFEDPERPEPEEVLDRFNGMSYDLEQENDRRNSIVCLLSGIRRNHASQLRISKFSSLLTLSRIVIIHDKFIRKRISSIFEMSSVVKHHIFFMLLLWQHELAYGQAFWWRS